MTQRTSRADPSVLLASLMARMKELEASVALQSERFASVVGIGAEISAARDTDQLLSTVMQRLASLVDAEAASLFMHDTVRDELWSKVIQGASLQEIRIPSSNGIAGHVFKTGQTLILGDAYADVRFNPSVDRESGFRTRSVIAAPLKHVSGRILGVVEVLHRRVEAFTMADKALVEGVASQIAAVLDNVLLVEALRSRSDELAERVHDLNVLFDVEQSISSNASDADLIDQLLGKAMNVTQAPAGSILLQVDDSDRLYFRSALGDGAESLKSIEVKRGKGIVGFVTETGRVVRLFEASASPKFDGTIAKQVGISVGSVLCVPMHAEGRIIGALELLNKSQGFSAADERLAVLLSGQIARALVVRQSREASERRTRLEAIGQLLAGVLHDLKTPLSVISGYAEMMADEPDAAVRKDMSNMISNQLQHLSAMQRETLAFARGERTVLLRKVFLHAFMDEVNEALQKDFADSTVQLKIVTEYAGAARLDEGKIRRALFNLARNAREAAGPKGWVSITVSREGDDLVFTVADSGPGVPDSIRNRLFESFVTAGKDNGTGLGLSIVKKIAEEHRGTVRLTSKAGEGAVFELRFPSEAPQS